MDLSNNNSISKRNEIINGGKDDAGLFSVSDDNTHIYWLK